MAIEPMGGGKYPLIPLRNMLHCVFRGEDGHMGISPQTTTVEDEVWILVGLRRPACCDGERAIQREILLEKRHGMNSSAYYMCMASWTERP